MKILLAVDGSRYSNDAQSFLAQFPFAEPPDVVVVYVGMAPERDDVSEGIGNVADVFSVPFQVRGTELVESTAAGCRGWAKTVETQVRSGHVGREVVQAAVDHAVDLVVVGARGRNAVDRFLLGSVSDFAARNAPCSVLVVRPQSPKETRQGLKILIAVDEGESSASAVQRFASFPLGADSHVILMTVVDTVQAYHTEYTLKKEPALTRLLEHREHYLNAHAALLQAATNDTQCLVEEGVNAADHLLRKAESWQSDLLVVGSQSKTMWERVLLGSVSSRVLHHALCSVWIERKLSSTVNG